MWSATWPKEVRTLADEFVTHEAVRFTIGSDELMANKVPNLISLIYCFLLNC